MKRRSPLIGFTEAELGFVLAAVIAFAATAPAEPFPAPPGPPGKPDSISTDTVPARPDSSKSPAKPGLRAELPYCSQVGLLNSPVGDISILDTATYVLAGDTIDLAALQDILAPFVVQSEGKRCKYRLYFRLESDLSHRKVRKAQAPFFLRFVTSER